MNNLLEEVKVVLRNENNDKDYISICSIYKIIKKLRNDYEYTKSYYSNLFSDILKRYGISNKCIVNNFDFINYEISVFVENKNKESEELNVSYKDNRVNMRCTGSLDKNKIIKLLGLDLYDLYEQFMKYHEMYSCYVSSLSTDNENFLVDIDKYGVSLRDNNNKLQLSLYTFSDNYCYDSCDSEVRDIILGNEEELFKRIFVKIEELPLCIRQMLYMYREEELMMKDNVIKNNGFMKKIKSIFRKKRNS